MTQDTKKEPRICKDCGKEYEARVIVVLGVRVVFGDKYCPDCSTKRLAEIEAKEELARQAQIMTKRKQWRLTCGIPPKFMNEDFSTFEKERQTKAYKQCWDYAQKFPLGKAQGYPSLVLFSNESWGVGKTHLACAIAHRILDRWNGEEISCPVRFISEPDLLMKITATYSFNPEEKMYRESEADIINDLIRVPLLIVDDVGKRRVHDPRFVKRIMFVLIDGRYKNNRPIVITANLDPDRLAVYLGGGQEDEATFDRLIEMTGKRFYQLEGESYRRK